MRAARIKNGKIIIENVQKPVLEGLGAIVKVEGCGLCGSDIVKIKAGDENAILGHEIVGEIEQINSQTNFKVGDKIVMGHHYPCGECDLCKNESYSMCEGFKSTNISPCGFSEYIFVSEGHLKNTVFKTPLNAMESTFLEPLACCVRAVRRADLKSHQNALVIGLGSIGILMAQAIIALGNDAYGTDINPKRQEFARSFGIKMDENLKYDAVFMTSGSSKALPDALKYIKNGGKIVVFSSVDDNTACGSHAVCTDCISYSNNDIYYRELTVLGSYSPSPDDLKISHKLLRDGLVKVNDISSIYSLDNLSQAVNDTVTGKIFKAYVSVI